MPTDELCQQIGDAVKVLRKRHPNLHPRKSLEDYYAQVLEPQLRLLFPDVEPIVLGTIVLMVYLGGCPRINTSGSLSHGL